MSIYRGAGGAGDATSDATSQAILAAQSAIDAAASEAAAANSASAAASSATAAASSATSAASSATSASTSATNAATSATNAASSASTATTKAAEAATSATNAASSAATATTKATEAASSATAAASSASSAATSATNAASSATSAANSATAAASSATAAAASESAAATSETNAASSASAASTSATNAANSATAASSSATDAANSATAASTSASNAATSATNASNSATSASTSATNAANSATSASTSATNAASSATAAAASYDSFDDRYLGSKTSNPTLDNDGNALLTGALYWNSTVGEMRVYNGSAWVAAYVPAATYVAKAGDVMTGSLEVPTQASLKATTLTRASIRPSLLLDFANTKQLDPRITFSRPTTATYYDGKTVVKAEENLLKYSQEFDNAAWTKSSVIVTANAGTAPDGTSTADLIYPSTTGSQRCLYGAVTVLGTATTISIYAKASGLSWLYAGFSTSGGHQAWFNLTTGAVGTVGASISSSTITALGGGWYRCTVTATSAPQNFGLFGVADADNSLTVTTSGTSGIYIWGAQLEQRSAVTAYTPTTSSPITNYIPVMQTAAAGVPRFDCNPVTGESLGLLIEEQRTNLANYSASFDNAYWSKSNLTVTPNYAIAPDGTLTAGLVVYNNTAGNHILFKNSLTSVGTVYTISVYAKAYGNNYINLSDIYTGSATFDLIAGTVFATSGATASITFVGNGWYRCSVTVTATSAAGGFAVYGYNNGSTSFSGNGWAGTLVWGAQLEAGAFATSYIPTVASQVTRSADSASMTGSNFSSWYRADEGTLYAETAYLPLLGNYIAALGDNTYSNYVALINATSYQVIIQTNGVAQAVLDGGNPTINSVEKYSICYKTNDSGLSFNGAAPVGDTSVVVPQTNQLTIGKGPAGLYPIGGCIKRLAYYPARLSNTELQGLTS